MILRRNQPNQTVQIGPLLDGGGSPITFNADAYVGLSAGDNLPVHVGAGVWRYTFSQQETDQPIVTLRLASGDESRAVVLNFVTLAVTAEGFVNATVASLPNVTISQIQDREGDPHPIEPPAGDAYRLDTFPLNQMLNVLPGRDRGIARPARGKIVVSQGERITIARSVVDANNAAVNLSGRTLQFVIETAQGVDLAVIPTENITISGSSNNTYSFVVPAAASARVGNFAYALNDLGTSKAELAKGDWIVEARPLADS